MILWATGSLAILATSALVLRLKSHARTLFSAILALSFFLPIVLEPFIFSLNLQTDWLSVFNPFLTLGQALELDLFHSDLMYRHSDLANIFLAPAENSSVAVFYLVIFMLFFTVMSIGRRRSKKTNISNDNIEQTEGE